MKEIGYKKMNSKVRDKKFTRTVTKSGANFSVKGSKGSMVETHIQNDF